MKYKKSIIVAIIIIVCSLMLYFQADNIVLAGAKRQLRNFCPKSVVSIKGCKVDPAHLIYIKDLEIKVPGVYDINIPELKISYSILSLIKGGILELYMGGTSFNVNMGTEDISRLNEYFNFKTGQGAIKVEKVKVSNFGLIVKARDVNVSGKVSLEVSPKENLVKNIFLELDSMDMMGVFLGKGYIRGNPSAGGAECYFQNVKYNDVKLKDVSGILFVNENTVLLNPFSAKIFDGSVDGNMRYELDKNRGFVIELNAARVKLSTLVREMKLEEKFQMTGEVGGKAELLGNGFSLLQIEGGFATNSAGGVLTINDVSFLENMAKNSGESLDILMKSVKEYQYSVGLLKLSSDMNDLVLDASLEGTSGKRNFKLILHDILSKKGWGL